MVLEVKIRSHVATPNSKFFISPDELENGLVDIAAKLADEERKVFPLLTAQYVDDDTLEVRCGDDVERVSVWEKKKLEFTEHVGYREWTDSQGCDYGEECNAHVRIKVIPHVQIAWDIFNATLNTADGSFTIPFQRELLNTKFSLKSQTAFPNRFQWLLKYKVKEMDEFRVILQHGNYGDSDYHKFTLDTQDCQEVTDGDVTFSLTCLSVIVTEWDVFDEKPVSFRLDDKDFLDSEHDVEAAWRNAESVAEQIPECLGVIAKFMQEAADLGSKEAIAWLKDYFKGDGDYDAYA